MQASKNDDGDSDEEYSEEDEDSDDEPRIVAKPMDKKFTIDNIGQVSMRVQSRTRPLDVLAWNVPTFRVEKDAVTAVNMARGNLFEFIVKNNDHASLSTLLDMAIHFASQKLKGDEDDDQAAGLFAFPDEVFLSAIRQGRTHLLSEIIRRTGAGLPLDHLIKKAGVPVVRSPDTIRA